MTTDYPMILQQANALISGERDSIANMANLSALLFHSMHAVNWVGFYRVDNNELVLGPFQGQPACIRIPIGKGVCGTAVATKTTQIVEDVHQFEGHIACDAASNSEIVLPVIVNGAVVAVLDIDSPEYSRFSQCDAEHLQSLIGSLQRSIQ